jgi:hypothetical protein
MVDGCNDATTANKALNLRGAIVYYIISVKKMRFSPYRHTRIIYLYIILHVYTYNIIVRARKLTHL